VSSIRKLMSYFGRTCPCAIMPAVGFSQAANGKLLLKPGPSSLIQNKNSLTGGVRPKVGHFRLDDRKAAFTVFLKSLQSPEPLTRAIFDTLGEFKDLVSVARCKPRFLGNRNCRRKNYIRADIVLFFNVVERVSLRMQL